MEILKGVKTLDGLPAILIEKLRVACVADLHLGYELALAEKGVFVPSTQLQEILRTLRLILKQSKPETLILLGDVKHEFGEASRQEWREVRKLSEFLRRKVKKLILVRGNHDNYLLTICSHLGLEVHDPFYFVEGICFVHGHKRIRYPKGTRVVVTAHEHPSLALREGYSKVKVPCLLHGKTKDGKKLVCLPAISPLASGTEVNAISQPELLSPLLREEVELDELVPVVLDKEVGALSFPKLKFLSA